MKGKHPITGQDVVRTGAGNEPFSALVFKTTADPFVGKVSFLRVFSGTLKPDTMVYNATKDKMERIGQLFTLRGKQQDGLSIATAGDIAAVAKLQDVATGDTLTDKDKPILFDPIEFPQPMYAAAVEVKAKGDEDKLGHGLHRLMEEDPTFKLQKNTETGQLLVYGIGDVHLEVIMERLKRKFGVDVKLVEPKVPYRETIRNTVKVEGKHKKQSGGHGQYGHVWLRMEPLPAGSQFEFAEEIFGGAVPRQYVPAVEKGAREGMQNGVLAGYPIVDLKVVLYDGSYHAVDSSEMAFKIATHMALKKGVLQAKPILLEPMYSVEVVVPESYMGDIIGDFNSKRGRILGMEPIGNGKGVVRAQAPLAELFRYAIDLKSLTQGRGAFTMEFMQYEEVPQRIADGVIAAYQKIREEAH
jgi:elongation factor G